MLRLDVVLTNEESRLVAAALQTAKRALEKQLMGSELRDTDKSAAAFAAFSKLTTPIEQHIRTITERPPRRRGK